MAKLPSPWLSFAAGAYQGYKGAEDEREAKQTKEAEWHKEQISKIGSLNLAEFGPQQQQYLADRLAWHQKQIGMDIPLQTGMAGSTSPFGRKAMTPSDLNERNRLFLAADPDTQRQMWAEYQSAGYAPEGKELEPYVQQAPPVTGSTQATLAYRRESQALNLVMEVQKGNLARAKDLRQLAGEELDAMNAAMTPAERQGSENYQKWQGLFNWAISVEEQGLSVPRVGGVNMDFKPEQVGTGQQAAQTAPPPSQPTSGGWLPGSMGSYDPRRLEGQYQNVPGSQQVQSAPPSIGQGRPQSGVLPAGVGPLPPMPVQGSQSSGYSIADRPPMSVKETTAAEQAAERQRQLEADRAADNARADIGLQIQAAHLAIRQAESARASGQQRTPDKIRAELRTIDSAIRSIEGKLSDPFSFPSESERKTLQTQLTNLRGSRKQVAAELTGGTQPAPKPQPTAPPSATGTKGKYTSLPAKDEDELIATAKTAQGVKNDKGAPYLFDEWFNKVMRLKPEWKAKSKAMYQPLLTIWQAVEKAQKKMRK